MIDWPGLSKAELDEWNRTRYEDKEMEDKQERIIRNGLHCKVNIQLLHGNLWAIVIHPSEGFIHLKKEAGREEMRRRKEVLHISICFKKDIQATWQHNSLYALISKYMFPKDHVFKVEWFGNGVTANLSSEDSIYRDILSLHRAGSYWGRKIHISM